MNSTGDAANAGRAIGAMFFAFFGAAWLVWWCLERYGASPAILSAIALACGAIFFMARRQYRNNQSAFTAEADTPESKKKRRIFNIVNGIQWIAVISAVLALANTGHAEWIRVAIIFIVGVHFLPLAAVFQYKWHYVTGGSLIFLALVYPLSTSTGPLNPVGLFGAGIILWASALVAVMPNHLANR
jgi:hypothetical protein